MSIYPDSLMMTFEIAALDLPIPENLLDKDDRFQWNTYASSVSPARLLEKLGQALDEFHAVVNETDLAQATEDRKIKVYSKWEAAAILSYRAMDRFRFDLKRGETDKFGSDISQSLFYIEDFLRQTGSPQLARWQERIAKHHEVDNFNPPFWKFLNYIHDTYMRKPELGERGGSLQP